MCINSNRWARAVSDWIPWDRKRTAGRSPTGSSEFLTKGLGKRYEVERVPEASKAYWATPAAIGKKWKNYWSPLDLFDDQRDYT
ncbi:unnamed protein product [Angiostrongylus costaricensis]|uniref:Uncharacterized protein n=1 Tax=Angiostrongylus costaricensis TaxID=334426 RepID=A0A0R3PFH7_ANGCS|nr:unnamed protein product [Angiostrongylus costaricensis]